MKPGVSMLAKNFVTLARLLKSISDNLCLHIACLLLILSVVAINKNKYDDVATIVIFKNVVFLR